MNRKPFTILLSTLLMTGSGVALACDYKAGETKFADYAKCRYDPESILVVDLPKGSGWETCVYQLQAFRPEKLLAVTRDEDGVEKASINNRQQIGNPCYLTKQRCDTALQAYNQESY